ncbi:hypothetical protein [Methylorubrum extorquens]|uniref:hypothetical protein n=1 Tax=Methylorubrum extorquens TaxID=408 RepID=UPI00103A26E7|nr:hypothetical protein [Methylorubrum extorquens]MCP1545161.1 hypothetical protein [Methylorubrum extorquens]
MGIVMTNEKPSFWSSAAGIITALTGLIGAIATLLGALNTIGFFKSSTTPPNYSANSSRPGSGPISTSNSNDPMADGQCGPLAKAAKRC